MKKKPLLRLFITDDDADDREFLKKSLHKSGYRGVVAEFENGHELVSHLSANLKQLPDLILLDLDMPVKNGYDTLKEIRSNPDLQDIPVMVLSGSSASEEKATCLGLGAGYFQSKPYSAVDYVNVALSIMVLATY